MKLTTDIVLSDDKLTGYLLTPRQWGDKSKYLAQAGFTLENPQELKMALMTLATTYETVQDRVNEYGEFLCTDGVLVGVNKSELPITAIWLRRQIDGTIHFVTLKPRREKRK